MATREQLIEDFADHKYATGEKFVRLINSMKVVQEPVTDPQASGTSHSFIDSISQSADGKVTATKKSVVLNYVQIQDKPTINGVTLMGDKTPAQLGLATANQVEVVSNKVDKLPSGYYYGKFNSVEDLPEATEKGYAYVASSDPTVFYTYLVSGAGAEWVDSGNKMVNTVDLTTPKTEDTKLSQGEKYYASANVNDRPAQVDSETETVVSMGYKVLNPNLSFAEQVESTQTVDNSNMIFEIKDAFDVKPNNSGDVVFTRELTSNIVIGTKRIFYNPTTVTVDPANSLTGKYIFESNEVGLLPVKESYQSYDKVYTKHIFDSSENVYLAKAVYNYAKYTINKSGVYQSDSAGELVNATTIDGTDYISSAAFTLKSNATVANRETIVADEGCVILNSDGTSIISDENRSFTPADSSNVSVRIGMVVPTFTETFTIKPLYTINSGSVLKFNGGKIKNGAIDIEDVVIPQDSKGVFGEGIVITGRPTTIPMADWFDDASDSDKIRRCIEAFGICNLGVRNYIIDKPIIVSRSFTLKGQGMPDFPSHRNRLFDLNETDCGSNLIAQQGVSSILVVNNSVNGSSSALIEGVTFTAAIGNNMGSNGIEWCTPGAPSRPVIIRNCNFQFLNYGIYIHKGDSGRDDTNVAFATIECNNTAQCRWAIYCKDTYSLFNTRIVGNNFEFNTEGGIKIEGNVISSLDISWNDFEGQPTALDISVFWNIVYVKGNYFEAVDDIYFRGTYQYRSRVVFDGNYFWSPYVNNTIATIYATLIRFLKFEVCGNEEKVKLHSSITTLDKVPRRMCRGEKTLRVDYKNCKDIELIERNNVMWDSYTKAPGSNYSTNKSSLAPNYIFEGIPMKGFSATTALNYTNPESKLKFVEGTTYYAYFYAKASTSLGGIIQFFLYGTSTISLSTNNGICIETPNIVGLYRVAFTPSKTVDKTHSLGIQVVVTQNNIVYLSDVFISTNPNFTNLPIRPFDPTLIENAEEGLTLYSNPLGKNITYNGTAWVEEDSEMAGIKRTGTSSQRPTPTNIGFKYFDTTLGKPIFWNGVSWIAANGDYIFDNSGTLQNRLAIISPVKGQQFKLTREGETDVYLIYGDYGWLNATDRSPWFDDSGTLNAMYDKYNYTLLTAEPSNWSTAYNTYYKIVDGVYTKLNALEPWASDTYYKLDVNAYKGIQVKLTDTDTELLNKVVKWNGTKYINIVDNTALKAGTPVVTFTMENNTTTAAITSTSSGKIYYTKNGDAPTSSSTEYSSAITLADGDQVKAICIRDYMDNSDPGYVPVSKPEITFSSAGILTITCNTPNAKIYYTIDGSTPDTSSTEYDSSASVTIAKGVTVKAFAVLIGLVNSAVVSKKRS